MSEIENLAKLDDLDYLNLADNKISEINRLKNLINLRVLNLQNNNIQIIKVHYIYCC